MKKLAKILKFIDRNTPRILIIATIISAITIGLYFAFNVEWTLLIAASFLSAGFAIAWFVLDIISMICQNILPQQLFDEITA